MSDEPERLDEDLDNPFDLFETLGWTVSEQEDDEEEDDDEDFDELWDDDVHRASHWLVATALGAWGLFVEGHDWDGSRDLHDVPWTYEPSLYEHVRLVMDTRRAEREASRQP